MHFRQLMDYFEQREYKYFELDSDEESMRLKRERKTKTGETRISVRLPKKGASFGDRTSDAEVAYCETPCWSQKKVVAPKFQTTRDFFRDGGRALLEMFLGIHFQEEALKEQIPRELKALQKHRPVLHLLRRESGETTRGSEMNSVPNKTFFEVLLRLPKQSRWEAVMRRGSMKKMKYPPAERGESWVYCETLEGGSRVCLLQERKGPVHRRTLIQELNEGVKLNCA